MKHALCFFIIDMALAAATVMAITSCGSIPPNQAIIQDVANDLGITWTPTASGSLMAAGPATRESASAAKSKAFWGN